MAKTTFRPTSVNICGIQYTIEYTDTPSDVDIYRRESLWGQVDLWTQTIRIYDNNRNNAQIVQTIFHEVLHTIGEQLHLDSLTDEDNHDELDVLALTLFDVFSRNGWLSFQ